MLAEEFRLKKKTDFDTLFSEGMFFAGKLVNIKVWKINTEKFPKRKYTSEDLKIGFVVGLKHEKRAVGRNRAKRQMREVVRLLLQENRIKRGYFISILSTPRLIGAQYEEIATDITSVLRKARVLV